MSKRVRFATIRLLVALGLFALTGAIAGAPSSGRTAAAATPVRLTLASDPILGPARGSVAQSYAFAQHYGAKRLTDVNLFMTEVYRLAPLVGIDPAVVIAQSALETDTWRTAYWTDHRNPGGIGITYSDQESYTWADGTAAARGHLVHLYLYAAGEIPADHLLAPYKGLDPRYDAAVSAGYAGIATTLDGLTGRWATDPIYGTKIAGRANDIMVRHRLVAAGRSLNTSTPWVADDAAGSTVWATTTAPLPASAFVWFDLGASRSIGSVRWLFAEPGAGGRLTVQVSSDRVYWTNLAMPATSCARTWQETTTQTTGRYVRFLATKTADATVLGNIAEVQVWPPTDPRLPPLSPCPPPATATATPRPTAPPTATRTPVATVTATATAIATAIATATSTRMTTFPTASPTRMVPTATRPPAPTRTPIPAAYPIVGSGRTANSGSSVAVYDGNPATVWLTTAAAVPPVSAYVFVDLGAARPIASVDWLPGANGLAGAMSLHTSNDRAVWTALAQPAPGTANTWQRLPVAVTARYLRFSFTNPASAAWIGGLAEVAVWP